MPVDITINLASEPFGRNRPRIVAYAGSAVALTGVFVFLTVLAVRERGQAAHLRPDLARVTAQLRAMALEQSRLEGSLRQPANADVLEHSVFFNNLLERKGISWTRIFVDLEGVMPHNVRLISVRLPRITSQGEVLLDMVVGTERPDYVLVFMKRLEASPRFGSPSVANFLPPSQTDPHYRYSMSVLYGQKL